MDVRCFGDCIVQDTTHLLLYKGGKTWLAYHYYYCYCGVNMKVGFRKWTHGIYLFYVYKRHYARNFARLNSVPSFWHSYLHVKGAKRNRLSPLTNKSAGGGCGGGGRLCEDAGLRFCPNSLLILGADITNPPSDPASDPIIHYIHPCSDALWGGHFSAASRRLVSIQQDLLPLQPPFLLHRSSDTGSNNQWRKRGEKEAGVRAATWHQWQRRAITAKRCEGG